MTHEDNSTSARAETAREGFVWPPRPAASGELPTPPPRRAPRLAPRPDARRPPSLLEAVEREWLDITTEPIARCIARGDWIPDTLDLYCHRCGRSIGPHEADADGCGTCRGTRPPWARLIRLGPHEALLRELIAEVKFTRFRRLGADLGHLLGEAVLAHAAASQVSADELARAVVIPVPTTARRRLARGIDHTAVIARAVADHLGVPSLPALARRHVPSQLTVAPSRRAANVAGTMRLKARAASRLEGRPIIVVDDVCTTGATMRAACRAIRDGLRRGDLPAPTIWAAILARAAER